MSHSERLSLGTSFFGVQKKASNLEFNAHMQQAVFCWFSFVFHNCVPKGIFQVMRKKRPSNPDKTAFTISLPQFIQHNQAKTASGKNAS